MASSYSSTCTATSVPCDTRAMRGNNCVCPSTAMSRSRTVQYSARQALYPPSRGKSVKSFGHAGPGRPHILICWPALHTSRSEERCSNECWALMSWEIEFFAYGDASQSTPTPACRMRRPGCRENFCAIESLFGKVTPCVHHDRARHVVPCEGCVCFPRPAVVDWNIM